MGCLQKLSSAETLTHPSVRRIAMHPVVVLTTEGTAAFASSPMCYCHTTQVSLPCDQLFTGNISTSVYHVPYIRMYVVHLCQQVLLLESQASVGSRKPQDLPLFPVYYCFLQRSVSLSITLWHVSHTVLTRAVVSAWACPGHASPIEDPGRVCCHSTPPKDPVGPVRPRGLGCPTRGWAGGISPFAHALVSLPAVAQQQPAGL